jgi:hypothetical protein
VIAQLVSKCLPNGPHERLVPVPPQLEADVVAAMSLDDAQSWPCSIEMPPPRVPRDLFDAITMRDE